MRIRCKFNENQYAYTPRTDVLIERPAWASCSGLSSIAGVSGYVMAQSCVGRGDRRCQTLARRTGALSSRAYYLSGASVARVSPEHLQALAAQFQAMRRFSMRRP
jgi:hypothetical protein